MVKKIEVRNDISLEEIKACESSEKRKIVADRIRAIRLALEGDLDYSQIAKVCGKASESFPTRWIKRFNAEGFEGLETKEGQGPPQILNEEELKILITWMKDPESDSYNVWTAPRLIEKIKKDFNKSPSEQCIYDTLARLGFKHRKARPTPSKANQEELENFKK